jgi:hypothetical protein
MSMFTQWVPHEFAAAPHREELEAYAARVIARVESLMEKREGLADFSLLGGPLYRLGCRLAWSTAEQIPLRSGWS